MVAKGSVMSDHQVNDEGRGTFPLANVPNPRPELTYGLQGLDLATYLWCQSQDKRTQKEWQWKASNVICESF